MRVVVSIGSLVVTFVAAHWLMGVGLMGYLNLPALLLILVGPLAVMLMACEARELSRCAKLVVRAMRFREVMERERLSQALHAIARAHKSGRLSDVVQLVEATDSDLVRTAGLLVLKHYDERSQREVFAARMQAILSHVKAAEDAFMSLARLAPSFGLIGTILGFVDLLRRLDDPNSLGPGMAMALMATLYGISLSYCVYHPLTKAVATYGRKLCDLGRGVEHSLMLMSRGRHSVDLSLVLDEATTGGGSARAHPTPVSESLGTLEKKVGP